MDSHSLSSSDFSFEERVFFENEKEKIFNKVLIIIGGLCIFEIISTASDVANLRAILNKIKNF